MEAVTPEDLGRIVDGFFKNIHEIYTRWPDFVVRQDNHLSLHYFLHNLFFLPLEVMKRGKRVKKEELLEVVQQKAGEDMEEVRFNGHGLVDPLQSQMPDTKYFNFMTCALVDLIEGDSFLNDMLWQPEQALMVRASWENMAREAFIRRTQQLQRIDYSIRLAPEAITYLAVKAGVGRLADYAESAEQMDFSSFRERILKLRIAPNKKILEAAVTGYEDRLAIANTVKGLLQSPATAAVRALPEENMRAIPSPRVPRQLLPPASKPGLSGIYGVMQKNLYEKLGLEYSVATDLAEAIKMVREPSSSNSKKEKLKQSVMEAYDAVFNFSAASEAERKAATLSKLLKTVFNSYIPEVEQAFFELYKTAEEECRRLQPSARQIPKDVDIEVFYKKLQDNPAYRKSQSLCMGLQGVLCVQAEKRASGKDLS